LKGCRRIAGGFTPHAGFEPKTVIDEVVHLQKFGGDEHRHDVLHTQAWVRGAVVEVQVSLHGAVKAVGRVVLRRVRLMLFCHKGRLVLLRQKRGRE
jgi:hypothetical protein